MATRKNPSITVAFPTVTLRKLCDQAENLGLPQGPNARFWQDVDDDGTHVVSFNFPSTGVVDHGDGKQSVRAMVACKMRGRIEPHGLLCDFDYEGFTTLVNNGLQIRNHRFNRKRKLSPNDTRILAQVFKDCGADWTYKALAVWYGAISSDEFKNVKPYPKKALAALQFLREIIEEYTFNAIYKAADGINKPAEMIVFDQQSTVRKDKSHRRKTASAR